MKSAFIPKGDGHPRVSRDHSELEEWFGGAQMNGQWLADFRKSFLSLQHVHSDWGSGKAASC